MSVCVSGYGLILADQGVQPVGEHFLASGQKFWPEFTLARLGRIEGCHYVVELVLILYSLHGCIPHNSPTQTFHCFGVASFPAPPPLRTCMIFDRTRIEKSMHALGGEPGYEASLGALLFLYHLYPPALFRKCF